MNLRHQMACWAGRRLSGRADGRGWAASWEIGEKATARLRRVLDPAAGPASRNWWTSMRRPGQASPYFARESLNPVPSSRRCSACRWTAASRRPWIWSAGLHSAVFSKDHLDLRRVFLTTTTAAMPKTTVHKANGELVGELPSVARWSRRLRPEHGASTLRRSATSPVSTPASSGRTISTGTSVTPCILHVYGGPTHQMVQDAMGGRLIDPPGGWRTRALSSRPWTTAARRGAAAIGKRPP